MRGISSCCVVLTGLALVFKIVSIFEHTLAMRSVVSGLLQANFDDHHRRLDLKAQPGAQHFTGDDDA